MGYPDCMTMRQAVKPRIAITPDVDKELKALKKEWGLQSHNKVLRRLLGLTKDGRDAKS